jgi:hypothetical protein
MFSRDDYKKDLKEARKQVSKHELLGCILHHSRDAVKIQDIYDKSNECQHGLLAKNQFNDELQMLCALGLLYIYTNDTCRLSQLGLNLLSEMDKKGYPGHPVSIASH